MLTLRGLNGLHYSLQVQAYKGSHGTMLGRTDRFNLNWPNGPWDNEPDVIAWHYKQFAAVLVRGVEGRWDAHVTSCVEMPQMKLGDMSQLIGVSNQIGRLTPGFPLTFSNLGIAEYMAEHGYQDTHLTLRLHADPTTACPIEPNVEASNQVYRNAGDASAMAGRMIRALNLDPLLYNGTNHALAFDTAQQVNVDKPGKRFTRLDVQDVIANDYIEHIGPRGELWLAMKTWGDEFLLLRIQPGYGSGNTDAANLLFCTTDLLGLDALKYDAKFYEKCEAYIRANNLLPIAPVDEIDRLMNEELGALACELR